MLPAPERILVILEKKLQKSNTKEMVGRKSMNMNGMTGVCTLFYRDNFALLVSLIGLHVFIVLPRKVKSKKGGR